ncbi:MAG: FKBP-type peptidyl-prolyl cis-trans isomerase [Bacteroidetes bacterium]|jgi:FKBP-type peptidyl-prolyl cis-trans isomerase|nr:FKBP-type peptidyl-prolyl cis-trans isomerase [Bacteroidota bacterium]
MIKNTIKLLLAIVLFASCNQYEKTPSGLAYKVTKGTSKETLKNGQSIKLNIEYKLAAKDSILSSSYAHIPVYFVLDTAHLGKYNFTELLPTSSVGDKIEFRMSVDTLKKLGMVEYNDIFKKGDFISGRVDILKTFPGQPEMMKDYAIEMDAEKAREIKDLKTYADSKKLKTQSTQNGVLVEIQNPGTLPMADSGMQATILYRGAFVNGKIFDSNMVNSKLVGQPLNVTVGVGSVIRGWDEGLRLFGKGGKGRLLVPALLAYGPQGSAPVIPPYANLVFDIEITDVTVPAPKPAQPMPGQPNQGQPANH